MDEDLEAIAGRDGPVVFILRAGLRAPASTFLTPPESPFQVGLVDGPRDVARHSHRPVTRHLSQTAELVVVQAGRCEVEVYSPEREHLATRELSTGDAVLLLDGGHSFRLGDDARLLVVKQGPYTGVDEKVRF